MRQDRGLAQRNSKKSGLGISPPPATPTCTTLLGRVHSMPQCMSYDAVTLPALIKKAILPSSRQLISYARATDFLQPGFQELLLNPGPLRLRENACPLHRLRAYGGRERVNPRPCHSCRGGWLQAHSSSCRGRSSLTHPPTRRSFLAEEETVP